MTFVISHRVSGALEIRGRSMLRAGRLLASRVHTRLCMTPQERANLYVSRLPIAVVAAPGGGNPSGGPQRRA